MYAHTMHICTQLCTQNEYFKCKQIESFFNNQIFEYTFQLA